MTTPPRLLWHDGDLWRYTYTPGGFEGYQALRSRRRLAPDLRWRAETVSDVVRRALARYARERWRGKET